MSPPRGAARAEAGVLLLRDGRAGGWLVHHPVDARAGVLTPTA